ncbi:MAG: winged helix-turn-helix transcriptional regulator [Candidatus Altiarchaeota archaeon]|nr:winged helix-turn-helix transcriptional regulator [Candidatus Altiarchaeota archaeon]
MNSPACILLFTLFLASCVYAETYYADLLADLDGSGTAYLSGRTNHPLLESRETDDLTSKEGSHWLFNLTLPAGDVFTDYVYEVRLPEGASVNYVKASGSFRIAAKEGRIAIIGFGEDGTLFIVIQYQPAGRGAVFPYEAVFGVLALVLVLFLFWFYRKKRPLRRSGEPEDDFGAEDSLTERQKDILRLMREAGRPVNQTLVSETLGLPKSSVSRNVEALVKKGMIEKKRDGMSTMLSLKED